MAPTRQRQAAAAAAAEGKSDQYIVLSNLDHDGEHYAPGDPITLDPITAEQLLAVRVVQPATEAAKA